MTSTLTQFFSFELPFKKGVISTLQVLGASLLLALFAQISIPLPFSPVPLSGQTFGVMLIGATLGSRKGMLSVLAYLAEGAMGLPVFASGSLGLLKLLGPTGGYFLGFVFQAYLVGYLVERQNHFRSSKILAALLVSCAMQLSLGTLWLSHFVGFSSALVMGFFPFIVGEILKSIGVTSYLKTRHENTSL